MYFRKAIVLILIIFVNSVFLAVFDGYAQNSQNTERVEILQDLSKKFFFEYRNNNEFYEKLEAYPKKQNIKDSVEIFYFLGSVHYLKQDYLKSVRYFLWAYQRIKQSENNTFKAEIIFQLANSYQRMFYLKKAIEYYQYVLHEYNDYISPERKNRIIMDIGNSYFDLEDYRNAHKFYTLAVESSEKLKDSLYFAISKINFGNLNMYQNKFETSKQFTLQALEICKNNGYRDLIVMCHFNLGELHYLTGDYETTKEHFDYVLKEADNHNFSRLVPEVYKYLVLINYYSKDYKKAIQYCRDFYIQSFKYVVQEKKLRAIKEVNKILIQLENYPEAKTILNDNIVLLDSILFKEIKEKKLLAESLQQLAALESNYKILESENLLQGEKLLRSRVIMALSIFIVVLSSLFLLFFYRSKNKIKEQNKIIKKQYDDIAFKNHETEELNHEVMMQSEEIRVQNEQLTRHQKHLEKKIKEATKELRKALDKAKESDELKLSFLQNISHEIRTPLNAINGFAQLLANKNKDNKNYSDIITQSVNDLVNIIDTIILYSKLQANQYTLFISEKTINQILAPLKTEFSDIKNKYKLKEINFELDIEANGEVIFKTDIALIQKALVQLVENAYKFTEKGNVNLEVKIEAGKLLFSVTDTGIGIKNEKIPYIFDTFRKIEGDSKIFRGTGIGLTLVKRIVEILNGDITIESEFGKGTSISIQFNI